MAEKHFFEQKKHAASYLIPYFQKQIPDFLDTSVLEIGCAEAGFLAALQEKGVTCAGIELEPSRVETALRKSPGLRIITGDATDPAVMSAFKETFDLIILRDVIEHITDRERLFRTILPFLKPGGSVYISFPPRYSPFAGHQQIGRSLLRLVPWLQLCPLPLLTAAGRLFRERPSMIDFIHHNYRTGLTVSAFNRLWKKAGLHARIYGLFLLRPVHRTRYGVPIIPLPNIALIREIAATGCEVLLERSR